MRKNKSMDMDDDDDGIVWGDAVALNLVYVEVRPICPCLEGHEPNDSIEELPEITAAFVKAYLMQSTLQSLLECPTMDSTFYFLKRMNTIEGQAKCLIEGSMVSSKLPVEESNQVKELDHLNEVFYFPSNNPSSTELWPCLCRGYARKASLSENSDILQPILVTDSTFVRLHPIQCTKTFPCSVASTWKAELRGEVAQSFNPILEKALLSTQNPLTIKEFTLRMKRCFAEPIQIGTTPNAFRRKKKQISAHRKRITSLAASLDTIFDIKVVTDHARTTDNDNHVESLCTSGNAIFRDGAILIHSPDHGSGKTTLLRTIAHRLGAETHILHIGALLAEYGIHADTALQCILHAVVLDGSVHHRAKCIILDDFASLLPVFGQTSSINTTTTASPFLYAMASYWRSLTISIKDRHEFPFPSNNALYNLAGTRGEVWSSNLCLLAVLTCPDNDVRLKSHIVSAMGQYRLPSLSSATRLTAFQWAFQKENVVLSPELERQLPNLAASAVWAQGEHFQRIAYMVKLRKSTSDSDSDSLLIEASVLDLKEALSVTAPSSARSCSVQFLGGITQKENFFGVVGGCHEAKMVLEEALSNNMTRRKILSSFGLSPTTGILLYGPPGTGKTLLAKAVARLLQSRTDSASSVGGAFVSLSSTDIVRATVGSGEQIVVSAFQSARLNSPAVVFIDEFQALFTERSSGGSGRLTTTLLQCMDDVKQWSDAGRYVKKSVDDEIKGQVLILAATNTPWMIDPAFLRPGRFDRSVHVGLPSLEERVMILRNHIGRMRVDLHQSSIQSVCEDIAHGTQGYSGAALAALCRSAAVLCLVDQKEYVEASHFTAALNESTSNQSNTSLVEQNRLWRP